MDLLSTAAVIIHSYILIKGVVFFRSVGETRETDKVLVASLMALSVLFIAAVSLLWLVDPEFQSFHGQDSALMLGFIFSETFFNLAIITALTRHREAHGCSDQRG